MFPTRRRSGALLAGVLSLAAVPSGLAAERPAFADVSATDRGRQAIDRSLERFRADGYRPVRSALRVLEARDGDMLVLLRGMQPPQLSTHETTVDGRAAVAGLAAFVVGRAAAAVPDDGRTATASLRVAAAPYWLEKERGCFAWLRRGGSYLSPCYYISKLINDGDGSRDFFSLRFKAGVGTTRDGSSNWDAWIHADRTVGSDTQYRYDHEPGVDVDSRCQSFELGLPVKGVVISVPVTRCEAWDMTESERAGTFTNKWKCNCWFGVSDTRQVAFVLAVMTNQGRSPMWTLSAGFTGL